MTKDGTIHIVLLTATDPAEYGVTFGPDSGEDFPQKTCYGEKALRGRLSDAGIDARKIDAAVMELRATGSHSIRASRELFG